MPRELEGKKLTYQVTDVISVGREKTLVIGKSGEKTTRVVLPAVLNESLERRWSSTIRNVRSVHISVVGDKYGCEARGISLRFERTSRLPGSVALSLIERGVPGFLEIENENLDD
tara:strand:- start:101 stop:445 length:345 start_codon:yes stop_codon:yes gene_type:complete